MAKIDKSVKFVKVGCHRLLVVDGIGTDNVRIAAVPALPRVISRRRGWSVSSRRHTVLKSAVLDCAP